MSFVTSILSDDSKIFVRTMLISIANIDLLQRKFKVKISILDRLYLRVLGFFLLLLLTEHMKGNDHTTNFYT